MAEKKKKPLKIFLWVTIALAIFSLISAFLAYQSRSSFLKVAKETQGTIVGLEPQRKAFRPIVHFKTREGKDVEFTAGTAKVDTSDIKIGTKVSVLYHPKKTEIAEINTFWNIWFNPIIMLVFGLLPLIFILFLRWVFTPKTEKNAQEASS